LWSLARWRKHESEVQARRAVVIDIDNADKSLPARGDEERGWRKHWRRGIIGSIQDWAEGRKHRVVFMLAEMARYFDVEREVRAQSDAAADYLCPCRPVACRGLPWLDVACRGLPGPAVACRGLLCRGLPLALCLLRLQRKWASG
jgi:hypothetical protein